MSLSTSNSKFLNKTIWGIVTSGLLALIVSYALLWKYNNKRVSFFEGFLPTQARKIAPDIKTLILGNSTSANGLRSKFFSKKTQNLSMGAGNIVIAESILKTITKKNHQLKKVILCFDNLMFFVDSVKRRNGDYRAFVANGINWYDIPNVSMPKKIKFLLNYGWPIFSYPLKGKKLSAEGLIHFIGDVKKEKKSPFNNAVDQGAEKVAGYEKSHKQKKDIAINVKAFRNLVKIVKNNQLELVLVRLPVTREFDEGRSEWWLQTHNEFLEIAKNEMKNSFKYHDLSQLMKLGHEYFNDPNHLTKEGAALVSKQLDSLITKN